MVWDVRPRAGVGPLAFGASVDAVVTVLGAPLRRGPARMMPDAEIVSWNAGGAPLPDAMFVAGTLDELTFRPAAGPIVWDGLDLFADPAAAIARLAAAERAAGGRIFGGFEHLRFVALGIVVAEPQVPDGERTVVCCGSDRTEFYGKLAPHIVAIEDLP